MILNGLNNLEININGINCFLINDYQKHNEIIAYLEQYFDNYKYQLKDYDKYNVNEILVLDKLDIISRNKYDQCIFIDGYKDIEKYLKHNKGDITYKHNEHILNNININKYEEKINEIYMEIVNEYKELYHNTIFEINEKNFNHELFLKNVIKVETIDDSNINRIIEIVKMTVENSKNDGVRSFICLTNVEKYLEQTEYEMLYQYMKSNEIKLYADVIITYGRGQYINFDNKSYIINNSSITLMYDLENVIKIVRDNASHLKLANRNLIAQIIKENIDHLFSDKYFDNDFLEIINIIKNGKEINISGDILTISEM